MRRQEIKLSFNLLAAHSVRPSVVWHARALPAATSPLKNGMPPVGRRPADDTVAGAPRVRSSRLNDGDLASHQKNAFRRVIGRRRPRLSDVLGPVPIHRPRGDQQLTSAECHCCCRSERSQFARLGVRTKRRRPMITDERLAHPPALCRRDISPGCRRILKLLRDRPLSPIPFLRSKLLCHAAGVVSDVGGGGAVAGERRPVRRCDQSGLTVSH